METTPTLGALGSLCRPCGLHRKEGPGSGLGGPPSQCRQYSAAGARVVVISRTGADNYENLDRHRDAAILINATPVGMYPDNGESPWLWTAYPRLEAVFDLIYNPARTRLLLEAEARAFPAQRPHHAGGPGGQVLGAIHRSGNLSKASRTPLWPRWGPRWKTGCSSGCPAVEKPGLVSPGPAYRPPLLWMETESWRSGPECPFRCF